MWPPLLEPASLVLLLSAPFTEVEVSEEDSKHWTWSSTFCTPEVHCIMCLI